MRRLIIEVFREGYDTEQVRHTMTINEMIEYLKGGIDTDAVVDNLLEKVQLYLSE